MFLNKIYKWFSYYLNNKKHLSARRTLLRLLDDKPAITLKVEHVKNTKVVLDRFSLLKDFLPKNSVCAEVGIANGDFSEIIFNINQPRKLHLIELSTEYVDICKNRFKNQIAENNISVHKGFSYKVLKTFPDKYFDWIYIDGDHSYDTVKKDLLISKNKIKDDGLIMLDDYVSFSYQEMLQYGVVHAVNEFCCEENFEILGLSISGGSILKDNILGGKINATEYSNVILRSLKK